MTRNSPRPNVVRARREVADELTTPRLLLRCPRPGDGAVVHEAVVESLPDLRRWPASLPWVLDAPAISASEAFCLDTLAAFTQRTRLGYLAFDRRTGRFVACVGMQGIDWQVPKFEFGFWCRSSRLREGHMREALSALIQYAQDELGARRLSCRTEDTNTACRRLCEAVGMQLEGVLRNDRVAPDGTPRTCVRTPISRRSDVSIHRHEAHAYPYPQMDERTCLVPMSNVAVICTPDGHITDEPIHLERQRPAANGRRRQRHAPAVGAA